MNEAVFKTTMMGGFSKSDVLAFIDKQDRQFKDREKELLARVDTLSKSLKYEIMCTDQLKQRVTELEGQLKEEKDKQDDALRKLQDDNFSAAEIKADLSTEIENREAELDKVRLSSNELAQKLSEAEKKAADAEERADTIAKKLSLIDGTEDQIGRALLEAQKTSDSIVSAARVEADALLRKAREETDRLTSDMKEHVSEIKSNAQEKLDVLMRGVAEYEKRVSDARTNTADFFRAVDSMFTSLQNNADEILTDFTDTFKGDYSETSADVSDKENIPDEAPTESADDFTDNVGDNVSEKTAITYDIPAEFKSDFMADDGENAPAATAATYDIPSEFTNTFSAYDGTNVSDENTVPADSIPSDFASDYCASADCADADSASADGDKTEPDDPTLKKFDFRNNNSSDYWQ